MAEWSKGEDDKLAGYLAEALSASQIASMLPGRSRNAVIGRVHRLKKIDERFYFRHRPCEKGRNIKGKVAMPGKTPREKPARSFAASTVIKLALADDPPPQRENWSTPAKPNPRPETSSVADPAEYDRQSLHLHLVDLERHQCRWPVNDYNADGEHLFCGHRVEQGSSYCPHHAARSIGLGTPSERTAHKTLGKAR
jgi:GcrA cell cycle regulator